MLVMDHFNRRDLQRNVGVFRSPRYDTLLEKIFENDIKKARQIDIKTWADRSILEKTNEVFSRLWQSLP
jgi:hypothetical protein